MRKSLQTLFNCSVYLVSFSLCSNLTSHLVNLLVHWFLYLQLVCESEEVGPVCCAMQGMFYAF